MNGDVLQQQVDTKLSSGSNIKDLIQNTLFGNNTADSKEKTESDNIESKGIDGKKTTSRMGYMTKFLIGSIISLSLFGLAFGLMAFLSSLSIGAAAGIAVAIFAVFEGMTIFATANTYKLQKREELLQEERDKALAEIKVRTTPTKNKELTNNATESKNDVPSQVEISDNSQNITKSNIAALEQVTKPSTLLNLMSSKQGGPAKNA